MRVHRRGRGDGLRRLRGRLEPRPADRRRRPLPGAARAWRLHATRADGDVDAGRGPGAGADGRYSGPRRGIPAPRRVGGGEGKGDLMSRTAEINRETNETKVRLRLDLDGGEARISTGVGFLDH